MNEESFWKIIYIYINNYKYEMLHYRPEKKEVWLIDRNNEITRFIYSLKIETNDINADIYDITQKEKKIKKSFNLSSLKIKNYYISYNYNNNIAEYKKYKISESFILDRLLVKDKNINSIVKRQSDINFLQAESKVEKYKNKVLKQFSRDSSSNSIVNLKFNFISIIFIGIFLINYLLLNYSNYSLYDYVNYNYYKIISGQFYRVFTSSLILDDILSLVLIVFMIFICSIIFGDSLKIRDSILIYINNSLFCSLFLIFNYNIDSSIAVISFFGFLGSLFITELNKRNNNLKFLFSIILPITYVIICSIFLKINIAFFVFAFLLGIFSKMLYMKKLNVIISYIFNTFIVLLGLIIIMFSFNFQSKVNNYSYKKLNQRIENNNYRDVLELEREIQSNNKSILNYYELGIIKLRNDSSSEAKKIFEAGISFDDSFAPIYYQLALLYRTELEYDMVKKYIEKAIELDKDNDKYKNLKLELDSNMRG